MKPWKTLLLALSLIFSKAANQDSIFGCIYTCTRPGTTTDTSSVCSATHVTIDLDPSIRNQREARIACRDPNTESYENAAKFCLGGIRKCGAPTSSSSIVILNRQLTDAEKKSIQDVYVPPSTS